MIPAILILILLIPSLYCMLTLSISSIIDYRDTGKRFYYPVSSLLLESFFQYFVFIFLVSEIFSKWKIFDSPGNKIAILLPGYMETPFIFRKIRNQLKKNMIGYRCIKYNPFLGDLRHLTIDLKLVIESIIRENPQSEIFLVGHSMGGLIGRKLLENNTYSNVKSLIMIATPHKGTYAARFGIGSCSRQMVPGSDFLNELSDYPIPNSVNLYSLADSLVSPRENAHYLVNNTVIKDLPLHNTTMINNLVTEKIIETIDNGGLNSTD